MVKHIAIILDGNRRFARKLGREPWEGHSYGLKKLEYLFGWCREFGIKELTLYAFSTENFSRSRKEVVYIMGLFREYIEKLRDDKVYRKDWHVFKRHTEGHERADGKDNGKFQVHYQFRNGVWRKG